MSTELIRITPLPTKRNNRHSVFHREELHHRELVSPQRVFIAPKRLGLCSLQFNSTSKHPSLGTAITKKSNWHSNYSLSKYAGHNSLLSHGVPSSDGQIRRRLKHQLSRKYGVPIHDSDDWTYQQLWTISTQVNYWRRTCPPDVRRITVQWITYNGYRTTATVRRTSGQRITQDMQRRMQNRYECIYHLYMVNHLTISYYRWHLTLAPDGHNRRRMSTSGAG